MAGLSTDAIVGTWRVVRTEIPAPYNPGQEFFHFSPDGTHAWEYPFLDQPLRVFRFRYDITESGAHLSTLKGQHYSDLPMHFEGDLLVITGPHGYSSWLQRIPIGERPPFLSEFYEPPDNSRNV
jgi:hypothetical protein